MHLLVLLPSERPSLGQLFQIRNPKKSNAQLKGILEKAKQKLLKGEPVEQVKLWAKEQAGQ